MHVSEFLQTDDDTLTSVVADLRRRADAMDAIPEMKKGKYSAQAALRREASAIEQLLRCRVEVRKFHGAAHITFAVSGVVDSQKNGKRHTLFEIQEV